MVLGKILTHDFVFTSIHLNDCNLSNEGKSRLFTSNFLSLVLLALQALLHGLVTNTTCRTLELKGNGIHGPGTEVLARVLHRNQTLRK